MKEKDERYTDPLTERAALREQAEEMDQIQARRWEDARRMTGGGALSAGLFSTAETAAISE